MLKNIAYVLITILFLSISACSPSKFQSSERVDRSLAASSKYQKGYKDCILTSGAVIVKIKFQDKNIGTFKNEIMCSTDESIKASITDNKSKTTVRYEIKTSSSDDLVSSACGEDNITQMKYEGVSVVATLLDNNGNVSSNYKDKFYEFAHCFTGPNAGGGGDNGSIPDPGNPNPPIDPLDPNEDKNGNVIINPTPVIDSVAFSNVRKLNDRQYIDQNAYITNYGTNPIAVDSVNFGATNSELTTNECDGKTLLADGSCKIVIRYTYHNGVKLPITGKITARFADGRSVVGDYYVTEEGSYSNQVTGMLGDTPKYDIGATRGGAIVQILDEIHLYSGTVDTATTSSVHYSYNIMTNTWSKINPQYKTTPADIPTQRTLPAVGVMGYNMYVFGGRDTALNPLNDFYVFNSRNDTWRKINAQNMPVARYGATLTAIGTKLYLLGGVDQAGKSFDPAVYIYNPDTEKWDIVTSATEKGLHQSTAFQSLILSYGGMANVTPIGTLYKFDTKNNTMTQVNKHGIGIASPAVKDFNISTIGDTVVVSGGIDNLSMPVPDIYKFEASAIKPSALWVKLIPPPVNMQKTYSIGVAGVVYYFEFTATGTEVKVYKLYTQTAGWAWSYK